MPLDEKTKCEFAAMLNMKKYEDTSMLYDAENAAAKPGTHEKYSPLILEVFKPPKSAAESAVQALAVNNNKGSSGNASSSGFLLRSLVSR
jgi:hypothetical protein